MQVSSNKDKTKLTVKQQAFINEYIRNKGNATRAAIKAGYSEDTARYIGAENLTKPHIKAEIDKRLKTANKKKVAQGDEVLEWLTKFARGLVKEETVVVLTDKTFDDDGKLTNITTKPEIFKKKIVPKDQLSALDKLARIHGLYNDKAEPSQDTEQMNMHRTTIEALKKRRVADLDEELDNG